MLRIFKIVLESIGKPLKGFKQRGVITVFVILRSLWLQWARGKIECKDAIQEALWSK